MAFSGLDSKQFLRQKEQCLSKVDLSRKGSVDAPIADLVNFINAQPQCFTTSSCSGRIILVDNRDDKGDVRKQGCQWLHVTHEEAKFEDVKTGLNGNDGEAVFKFEPMVMHIQVESLQIAQHLHSTAVASGFRNSGISIGGKGKIIVAVRSTHSLEVPLSTQGHVLVSDEYIQHLVNCANHKMQENITRIDRFFDNVKTTFERIETEVPQGRSPRQRKQSRLSKGTKGSKDGQHIDDSAKNVEHFENGEKNVGANEKRDVELEDCFQSMLFDET